MSFRAVELAAKCTTRQNTNPEWYRWYLCIPWHLASLSSPQLTSPHLTLQATVQSDNPQNLCRGYRANPSFMWIRHFRTRKKAINKYQNNKYNKYQIFAPPKAGGQGPKLIIFLPGVFCAKNLQPGVLNWWQGFQLVLAARPPQNRYTKKGQRCDCMQVQPYTKRAKSDDRTMVYETWCWSEVKFRSCTPARAKRTVPSAPPKLQLPLVWHTKQAKHHFLALEQFLCTLFSPQCCKN